MSLLPNKETQKKNQTFFSELMTMTDTKKQAGVSIQISDLINFKPLLGKR